MFRSTHLHYTAILTLSQCLLISVSGQKAEFFFRTRKMLKVCFCFLLHIFGLVLWRSVAWRTIIAGLYYVLHFKMFQLHLFVVCFQGKEKAERSRSSAGQWNCTLPTNDQDVRRKGRQEKRDSATVSTKTQEEAILSLIHI